jgi:hypothetical protein
MDTELNGRIIYEVAFAFYFVIAFFQTSTYTFYFPGNFLHELAFVPLSFVLFKIFFLDSDSLGKLITNLLIMGLLFITWRTSGEFILFPMGIFVLGARNVDFKRIIYLYFILGSILLTFIFFTSLMGLTNNLVFYRGENTIRRSFGINYPTDFAAHVLYLVIAYCYLYFEKLSWKSYAVFILLAIFLIKFCDARLSAYALIILIPIMALGLRANRGYVFSKKIARFYWTLPSLTAYVVLFITWIYSPDNKIIEKINRLLSGRINLGHRAFENYGVKLFGQHISENGYGAKAGKQVVVEMGKYFYIDSAFIRLLVIYGIIMTVLVIIAMTVISWRSIKAKNYALASVLVVITISAVVEQRLLDFGYNPFLIALFAQCYLSSRGEQDEKEYIK